MSHSGIELGYQEEAAVQAETVSGNSGEALKLVWDQVEKRVEEAISIAQQTQPEEKDSGAISMALIRADEERGVHRDEVAEAEKEARSWRNKVEDVWV